MIVNDVEDLDKNWRRYFANMNMCAQLVFLCAAICLQYTIVAAGMSINVKVNTLRSHSSPARGDPKLPQDDYRNNPVWTVPIIVISHANNYFR